MDQDRQDLIVKELTPIQNRLYGFILTLLPIRGEARDVLQDVNLVIWRKAEEFKPGTVFWAWAVEIARYRVMAYQRDRARDRHIFNADMVSNLTEVAHELGEDDIRRRDALHGCLSKLNQRQRELVKARYRKEQPLSEIACQRGKTIAAVKMELMRIRHRLLDCIERTLGLEGS